MRIQGARLLVAEDDPILGPLWIDVVGAAGASGVGPFATIRASLASIGTMPPSVAMLDIQLLDGNSFPIARALRELGVPFVFVSSFDPLGLPEEFIDSPYLRKPATIRELFAAFEHMPEPV